MTIESFEGIIISETNYSESSKILNVLTDKYGLIGVMSKGCRNIKSDGTCEESLGRENRSWGVQHFLWSSKT